MKIADKPKMLGVYVAYIDDEHQERWAKREFLFWDDRVQRWFYLSSDQKFRGVVHGCIGPLPAMEFQA